MTSASSPQGVTVVIPTINRANVLVDTVRDLLAQQMENYEIVIVDQSECVNERILALAQSNVGARIRYFKADFKGLPQARNFGWRQATKDIVLYIDDDIRADSNLVRRHFDCHVETGTDMVAGGIDEFQGNHDNAGKTGSLNWWTATAVGNFHFSRPGWCLQAKGANFSIRSQTLAEIGGFDEVFSLGAALYEETEFALRLKKHGGRTFFEPTARLLHLSAPTGGCRVLRDWPAYMHGLAHNRAILIFRHLRWWHRPTAILRLIALGVAYSRQDGTLRPGMETLRGLFAGRLEACRPPMNSDLRATQWPPPSSLISPID